MGYRSIENLYKAKTILMFKEAYALEKLDGTSCHVAYNVKEDKLVFFSGCINSDYFKSLFDHEFLLERFRAYAVSHPSMTRFTVYGEGYGGKVQRGASRYGNVVKFCAFEVCVTKDVDGVDVEYWKSVLGAEFLAKDLNMEFVHYVIIPTTEEAIEAEKMADSVQAIRNGMGPGIMREGIVLRPLVELVDQNGGRIIAKHKREEFRETTKERKVFTEEELIVLKQADEIANEWVTEERLKHVVSKLGLEEPSMKQTQQVIKGMLEDIEKESVGEVELTKEAKAAISKKTPLLFKKFLKELTFV